jgi:hypothetical protein
MQRSTITVDDFCRAETEEFISGRTLDDVLGDALEPFYRDHEHEFSTPRLPHQHAIQYPLRHEPGQRHPLWWRYSAPESRDATPEVLQLARLGVLGDQELALLRRQHEHELDNTRWLGRHEKLFRRSPLWWLFGAEPRDDGSELAQLVRLDALDDRERKILRDGPTAETCRGNNEGDHPRFWCRHLTPDERLALGFPLLGAAD